MADITDELKAYLQGTFPSRIQRRAEAIIDEFERLTEGRFGAITDLHVGNYVSRAGEDEFDSLWIFTPGCVVEAKYFAEGRDYLRVIPLRESVEYFEMQKQGFNLMTQVDQGQLNHARMQVVFRIGQEDKCELNAAGRNCTHLANLAQRRIVPNIRAVTQPTRARRTSRDKI